jgi:hypothetical protein
MATVWWVVSPAGANEGSATNPILPAGSKIISTTVGSAEYNAFEADNTYGALERYMGPFTTEAQAKAAKPPGGITAIGDLIGLAAGGAVNELTGQPVTNASGGNLGSAAAPYLGAITDAVKYPAAIAEWIGNRGNWLRIMKVIAGMGLIFLGFHHISAVQDATRAVTKVAETAAIA